MSDFKAKMHQIFKFGWVSTSDVTGETYSTHILLAEFKGPTSKGKGKGIYNTAIAPQAAYHSCSSAFVSQTQAQLMPKNFDLQPNSHTQSWPAV